MNFVEETNLRDLFPSFLEFRLDFNSISTIKKKNGREDAA